MGARVAASDVAGLTAVRAAYLEALEAGEDELVVDLAPGCLGLDSPGALASLELASVNAKGPPQLAVTLRCADGLCVLAGISLQVNARSLLVENVAIVGAAGSGLAATVSERAELRGVIVLGNTASEFERAAVDLGAAGEGGTAVRIERTVVGRNTARDAALGLYCAAGASFEDVTLDEVTVSGGEADALVAIEIVRRLRATRSRFGAAGARTLLRLGWPVPDGELSDCLLAPGSGELVEVGGKVPGEPPRLRLTGGQIAAATALPAAVEAGGLFHETAPAELDAAIDAAVAEAAARVRAVDARLGRQLG